MEFVRCLVGPVNNRKQVLSYATDKDEGLYGIILRERVYEIWKLVYSVRP